MQRRVVGVTGLEPVTPSLSSSPSAMRGPQDTGVGGQRRELLGHMLVNRSLDHNTIQLAVDLLQASETAGNPSTLVRAAAVLLVGKLGPHDGG